jgi:GH15 family glucan-1,4-alpha-glucosidase
MPYRPIHDYGLIGDMNSAALFSCDGSIDWACFPRFDSPSVFAAILDERKGGRFAIAPVGEFTSEQRYRPETTVLETMFSTATGRVAIVDFMPTPSVHRQEAPHEIIRMIHGIQGTVRLRAIFEPRLDYAHADTVLSVTGGVVNAIADDTRVCLVSDLTFAIEPAGDGGQRAVVEFDVSAGESTELVAVYGTAPPQTLDELQTQEKLARSDALCASIVAEIDYNGRWRDEVIRSVLTLHLLTYDPSGAIVAAPTTSLPEFIGGERNWDCRYSWIRDAAWTVGILYRLGDAREGEEYIEWLANQCWLGLEGMQILYGISDDSDLSEHELHHLSGYENSGPVRIGNGAAYHRQLDVLGEMVLSLATYHKHHGPLSDDAWQLVSMVADLAVASWQLPDNGMWEVRGQQQHFVSSKIMCWVALDRASKLADAHGHADRAVGWREVAKLVHADVLANGWSEARQSFTQSYRTDALDASALLIPFLGFLPNDDPRVASTIRAVQRELADGPFVRRYIAEETDDGFSEGEGAFFILSFWLVGALLAIDQRAEAEELFDQLIAKANHLGLFAEMWDPADGRALGNFPQAFSHIGFLHTARNLDSVLNNLHENPSALLG